MTPEQKRIRGWMFFDWASQPYSTLLLTFIFAPYMSDLLGSGTAAQTVWGYGVGLAGIVIALASPFLGAIADRSGRRMGFVVLFSAMYVVGAWGLWWAKPGDFSLLLVMLSFAVGLIGMEFATSFTNALLPGLTGRDKMGRVSGAGWAFGYVGGLVSLVIMIALLQVNPKTGHTLIGLPPLFGLDPATREDTRIVGPLTAVWYVLFMVPFFLWVRDPRPEGSVSIRQAGREAWPRLRETLRSLPKRRSLMMFLIASMLYRDALNGVYTFGGIFARGVLGWSILQIAVFGILGTITGAIFAWAGGKADDRFGPKTVIAICLLVLCGVVAGIMGISRTAVWGHAVAADSVLPDIAFYLMGGLIGAAGGALQAASRTLMAHQSEPGRMTESFGLYALTGKATAFLAPLSIAIVTHLSASQSAGIAPVLVLFGLGLVLMLWVKTNPVRGAETEERAEA